MWGCVVTTSLLTFDLTPTKSKRSHRDSEQEGRTMTTTHETRTITSSHEVAADRSSCRLLGLTSALLALQVLNLAVFDDLRTDDSVGVLETFAKPQHLSSIAAVLLAVILVARRHRHAARVAVVIAWIEIAAFTF